MLTARLSLPIVLGIFIDWFSDPLSETIPKLINPDVDGYIWAALFSAISFIYGLTMAPTFHLQMVQGRGFSPFEPYYRTTGKLFGISLAGHHLRVQSCSLLYKKILQLNSLGMSKVSIGKLINLMSNDASRYEMFMILSAQVGVPKLSGVPSFRKSVTPKRLQWLLLQLSLVFGLYITVLVKLPLLV